MTSDINALTCYYDSTERFPIINTKKIPSSGFVYLVCENPKSKHVNKLSVQHYDDTNPPDYDFSNEVEKLRRLDVKYMNLLNDFPNFLINNYESIKNSYVMGYKIEMAAGIRFIIERFVYNIIAAESNLSDSAMRAFGLQKCSNALTDSSYVNKNFEEEINLVRKWKESLFEKGKMPIDKKLKEFFDAYDKTSDELHNGMISRETLYDAFENTMNFLFEFHKLGNLWSE